MSSNNNSTEKSRDEMVHDLTRSMIQARKRANARKHTDDHQRARWIQIHAYTSNILNTLLRDRQLDYWDRKLDELQEYRKNNRQIIKKQNNLTLQTVPVESSTHDLTDHNTSSEESETK